MTQTHIWLRAEERAHEARTGLTLQGAKALVAAGVKVTVERSSVCALDVASYHQVGAELAEENSWPDAPEEAIIFGLKELPDTDMPLRHTHLMFGHAYKGQHSGRRLLQRFKEGGGTLLDLEYLVDETGRRVAAFGYWAGFAGAAVTLKAWSAQQRGQQCGSLGAYSGKDAMLEDLRKDMQTAGRAAPRALVIGALGRVGSGACDLCTALGVPVTRWDVAETAHGGPFPEILEHDLLFNCILASPGVPQFVPVSALTAPRNLSAIGDIACDPDSDYSPIPIYERATSWTAPVVRAVDDPILDVMAIDNLPALLPVESSEDFAAQLLPALLEIGTPNMPVWQRARDMFHEHLARV